MILNNAVEVGPLVKVVRWFCLIQERCVLYCSPFSEQLQRLVESADAVANIAPEAQQNAIHGFSFADLLT
jgi:hypothetical protein